MKVLIVEDEPLAAQRLEKLLAEATRPVEVIGQLDTVSRTVDWLQNKPAPDLIFMDIQLADGLCFDIFDQVSVPCPVIFTTSYDQYAIRAFKVNSIDYLLKPLDRGELLNAINKFDFITKKYAQNPSEENKAVIEALKMLRGKNYKERFMVRVGEHIRSVAVDEIDYFVSEEKATYAQTKDGRRHLLEYPLDQLEALLNPEIFFRINRKYILSIHGFQDIISYSGTRLKVQLKQSPSMDAIVSRERVRDFKAWLDR